VAAYDSFAILTLQRHFSALTKFAHVELRVCSRKRRGKAALDVPINPYVRSVGSRSVAVGIGEHGEPGDYAAAGISLPAMQVKPAMAGLLRV
jgi:hypothetical protein